MFSCGSGETCAPGEYRQYIMGTYTANGSIVPLLLCGTTYISATVYQEDSCPPPVCTAYGYRACPTGPLDNYTPDQATGCNFYMYDAPGFYNIVAGTTYVLALSFRGQLINTAASNAVLQSQDWTVNGSATTPPSLKSETPMAGLQSNDKIVAVRTSRNVDNGAPEVQVIIARRAGEPPIDPNSIAITLKDARGQTIVPVAPPIVHEVSRRGHSTATMVLTLPQGSVAPFKAEFGPLRAAPTVMDVEIR